MNLKYDIFGIVKNAGKISTALILMWGAVFSYIFLDVDFTSNAYAEMEAYAGPADVPEEMQRLLADPEYKPEPMPFEPEAEALQVRPIRIKPYTNL